MRLRRALIKPASSDPGYAVTSFLTDVYVVDNTFATSWWHRDRYCNYMTWARIKQRPNGSFLSATRVRSNFGIIAIRVATASLFKIGS